MGTIPTDPKHDAFRDQIANDDRARDYDETPVTKEDVAAQDAAREAGEAEKAKEGQ